MSSKKHIAKYGAGFLKQVGHSGIPEHMLSSQKLEQRRLLGTCLDRGQSPSLPISQEDLKMLKVKS